MKKHDNKKINADFGISLSFEKGSESPSRVFKAMTELIESFQDIDCVLIESIDSKIKPVLILEDIEIGSIRGWFSNTLKAVEDEAIKDLDWKPAVRKYLARAKFFIIDFMAKRTTITSSAELEELEAKLLQAAVDTDVTHFPSYTGVNRQKLVPNIKRIGDAMDGLSEANKVMYYSDEGDIEINQSFKIVPENVNELLTKQSFSSKATMILKVKKPDYLGDSMWEFRHGTKSFMAKIIDLDWLKKFQNREKDVRPGDSLKVTVETNIGYGYDNEPVDTSHTIIEVLDVIQNKPPTDQLTLIN